MIYRCAITAVALLWSAGLAAQADALDLNADTVVHAGVMSPDLANPQPGVDAYYGEVNLDWSVEPADMFHTLLDLRVESVTRGDELARRNRVTLQARPGLGLDVPITSNFRVRGAAKLSQSWGWVRRNDDRTPIEVLRTPMLELGAADWYRGAYWQAGVAHNQTEEWFGRTPWQAVGQVHVEDSADSLSWGVKGRVSSDLLELGLSLRFF